MFQREHLTGATHAALDFIDDQKDAVLVANSAHLLQKTRRRRNVAALALNWFHDNGSHLFGRRGGLEEPLLNPIHRALDDTAITAIFSAERIVIFVRKRHMDHIENLPLEAEALGCF